MIDVKTFDFLIRLFLLHSLCISIFSILILLNNSSCSSSFLFFCKFLIPNTIKNNPSKIRTNITAKFQMLAKHTKIIASVCNTNNIILSLLLKKSCKNFFISYIPKNFKIFKVSCRLHHHHLIYMNFSYYTSQPPTLLAMTSSYVSTSLIQVAGNLRRFISRCLADYDIFYCIKTLLSHYTSQPPTLLVVTFVTSIHFVDTGCWQSSSFHIKVSCRLLCMKLLDYHKHNY